jgi:hypothetical protein
LVRLCLSDDFRHSFGTEYVVDATKHVALAGVRIAGNNIASRLDTMRASGTPGPVRRSSLSCIILQLQSSK